MKQINPTYVTETLCVFISVNHFIVSVLLSVSSALLNTAVHTHHYRQWQVFCPPSLMIYLIVHKHYVKKLSDWSWPNILKCPLHVGLQPSERLRVEILSLTLRPECWVAQDSNVARLFVEYSLLDLPTEETPLSLPKPTQGKSINYNYSNGNTLMQLHYIKCSL